MAGVYETQERYKEAASSYTSAAGVYAKSYGDDHAETVDALEKAAECA
eukprot:CAMPEP_0197587590 /NCGR_PEP_ID=MMETSP1326-20131121/9171_1 /TAXON_ID=1155430 /ORGANISM="Genus nov. species nov., Strain RCC2288" /LENGTH=47 /DNA_ID= /DNA_START= /DNA_END= /DNA_ORIENTATION=